MATWCTRRKARAGGTQQDRFLPAPFYKSRGGGKGERIASKRNGNIGVDDRGDSAVYVAFGVKYIETWGGKILAVRQSQFLDELRVPRAEQQVV